MFKFVILYYFCSLAKTIFIKPTLKNLIKRKPLFKKQRLKFLIQCFVKFLLQIKHKLKRLAHKVRGL